MVKSAPGHFDEYLITCDDLFYTCGRVKNAGEAIDMCGEDRVMAVIGAGGGSVRHPRGHPSVDAKWTLALIVLMNSADDCNTTPCMARP